MVQMARAVSLTRQTNVVSAMALGPSTNAVVRMFLPVTATATATSSTLWACAVGPALQMRTATAFATMLKFLVALRVQRATTMQTPLKMTDPATSALVPEPVIIR